MSNGQSERIVELIARASDLQKQAREVETLRGKLRADFPDEAFKPIVEAVLATDRVDSEAMISQLDATKNEIASTLSVAVTATHDTVSRLLYRSFMSIGALLVLVLLVTSVLVSVFGSTRFANTLSEGALFSLVAATVIVLGIVAIGLLCIGFVRSLTDFDSFWRQAEKVLQSGVFYFFAGLVLLLYAIRTTNAQEHPSLTFLLAMLGVAIMLFGTGSHAAGAIATAGARLPAMSEAHGTAAAGDASVGADRGGEGVVFAPAQAAAMAETSAKAVQKAVDDGMAKSTDGEKAAALAEVGERAKTAVAAAEKAKITAAQAPRPGVSTGDWGPVKANAAIAGGAAVLTALFGWGVIAYSDDIRRVFADYDQYQKIIIDACASYDKCGLANPTTISDSALGTFSLDDYAVTAEMGNGPFVFMSKQKARITLLVFANDLRESSIIRFTAHRRKDKSSDPSDQLLFENEIDIDIRPANLLKRPTSGANETAPADDKPQGKSECATMRGTAIECKLMRLDLHEEGRVKTVRYSLNFFRGANNAGQVALQTTARSPAGSRDIVSDAPLRDQNIHLELEPYTPQVRK